MNFGDFQEELEQLLASHPRNQHMACSRGAYIVRTRQALMELHLFRIVSLVVLAGWTTLKISDSLLVLNVHLLPGKPQAWLT